MPTVSVEKINVEDLGQLQVAFVDLMLIAQHTFDLPAAFKQAHRDILTKLSTPPVEVQEALARRL